ncbi:LanC-like protein [Echinococcus granulosus]|uniref:LanC-like protein n=1 Tax=Echinococcus granulosus TaxID=6210 RepID=W6UPQ7_ECHGR|nr:LanC-like protein [Echinococcus granulosus]EUB55384.1 LanC-like protein [Echinococcus granulosus]
MTFLFLHAYKSLQSSDVTWLARLQLSSGNWPSSLGSSIGQDRLVQWCHGAPGIVPLLLCAYKLTGEEDYLKRAERGGEVIWERGLLTKGCGLCHGSAGSGYALLSLYQHTGNTKYLQMAGAVSSPFAFSYSPHSLSRLPPNASPYRLLSGARTTSNTLREHQTVLCHCSKDWQERLRFWQICAIRRRESSHCFIEQVEKPAQWNRMTQIHLFLEDRPPIFICPQYSLNINFLM